MLYSRTLFLFSFSCAVWLVGVQFPNQGFNPGHSSESPEF